jgi:hypothetical protein
MTALLRAPSTVLSLIAALVALVAAILSALHGVVPYALLFLVEAGLVGGLAIDAPPDWGARRRLLAGLLAIGWLLVAVWGAFFVMYLAALGLALPTGSPESRLGAAPTYAQLAAQAIGPVLVGLAAVVRPAVRPQERPARLARIPPSDTLRS